MKKELQSKIGQITNLPTLPVIVSRVMQIINNPASSTSDVAFIVGQDLALSAKILRLANSAFYGMPSAITSINNAVSILGLKVINTIVLNLTVFDLFPHEKKSSLFDRTAFWRHSTSCALICRFLTERLRKFVLFDAEEAFCAGLLHDIGKVVMEQYLHEDFHKALKRAKQKKLPLYEAEKETLGYAHTDVAQWLLSGWQLPLPLSQPLVYHHDPQHAKECADIVALCHYADWLCYEFKLTIGEDFAAPPLNKAAVEPLEIRPDDIEALKAKLSTELERVDVFCDIAVG
ncbi:MAG TPA: HDOD domain-containing protein [Chitinivibrionales bacterium]|nr:HDOD domain-containing protein [Chitinivibrionales bacterium]